MAGAVALPREGDKCAPKSPMEVSPVLGVVPAVSGRAEPQRVPGQAASRMLVPAALVSVPRFIYPGSTTEL